MQYRLACLSKPKISWPWPRSNDPRNGSRLDRVSWRCDSDVRECRHYGEVLDCMMRIAMAAISQSAAYGHDLYVQIVIANVVPNLLETTHHWKVRNGVSEHSLAHQGRSEERRVGKE